MRRVFGDLNRSSVAPYDYDRPRYVYLNESARPEAGVIRDRMEAWFSRWPAGSKAKRLLNSLQSPDDHDHWSGFFELVVREILLRLGFSVDVEKGFLSGRTPDFLATDRNGERIAVEARIVAPELELQTRKRQHEVGNRLAEDVIRAEVSGQEAENIGERIRESILTFQSGLTIQEEQVIDRRETISHLGEERAFSPWMKIFDGFSKKAKKYAGLGMPFVIALDYIGRLDAVGIPYLLGYDLPLDREHSGVSAGWYFSECEPWCMLGRRMELMINQHADNPLPASFTVIREFAFSEKMGSHGSDDGLRELLGLERKL